MMLKMATKFCAPHFSANQRPRWTYCFSDQLKKHKLRRGHYDLASRQVALNSFQRFQISKNVSANQRPGQLRIVTLELLIWDLLPFI